jgi:hypothetical protein
MVGCSVGICLCEKRMWWWCCVVVWVEVVSVEGEAQKQNVKGQNTPHERQAAAEVCLAVRCSSREAREGVVVARRCVRMGMGGFAKSLRDDTAYTDPFPASLGRVCDLGGALRPTSRCGSLHSHGGEARLIRPCLCLKDTPRAVS